MEKSIIGSVSRILSSLYGHGNINKAALAGARHGASMLSAQAQAVWPVMMAELPESKLSWNGEPTYAEIATYAAIRLYAIHQQGTDTCVYASLAHDKNSEGGTPLFAALANLRQNEKTRVALDRRVQALLATTNVNSVINSLTHLVAILKAKQPIIQIDYACLANELYYFQMNYESANRIRLEWGQQYFHSVNKVNAAQNEGEKK